MVHTASEVHGTGAGTTLHGIGIHGLTVLGDITDGMTRSISEAGTTLGITADGMTLGIMEDGGVGMTLGTIIIIIADGTAAGILTGVIITTDMARDMYQKNLVMTTTRWMVREEG